MHYEQQEHLKVLSASLNEVARALKSPSSMTNSGEPNSLTRSAALTPAILSSLLKDEFVEKISGANDMVSFLTSFPVR